MNNVIYALTEHLPLSGGVSKTKVHSEHPTVEAAIAARDRLYDAQPELIGCVTIVPKEAVPLVPAVRAVPVRQGT